MDAKSTRESIVRARNHLSNALRAVSVPEPDPVSCWAALLVAYVNIDAAIRSLNIRYRKIGD